MLFAIECGAATVELPSGIARYVIQLTQGFSQAAQADPSLAFEWLYPVSRKAGAKILPCSPQLRPKAYSRSVFNPLFVAGYKPDVLMATRPTYPRGIRAPLVATIHDLHPVQGVNLVPDSRSRLRDTAALKRQCAEAHRLIAISEHSARDLRALLDVPAERIRVVLQGLDPVFANWPGAAATPIPAGLPKRPFFLMSAEQRPSKNFARMLKAFAASGMARNHDLAITGAGSEAARAALHAVAEECGIARQVVVLGFRPYAELPAIYAQASGLLFASLAEGFGYPIIEAMSVGTPVLTSTTTSCPEVAGGHAVLVEPESVEAIAAGIPKLLSFSAAQITAAEAHARSFTLHRTVMQTLEVLREAAGKAAPVGRA